MGTDELIVYLVFLIPLIICGIIMLRNRKVSLDYMLSNWYRFSKPSEYYNEKGNKAGKIGLAILIIGFIALIIVIE